MLVDFLSAVVSFNKHVAIAVDDLHSMREYSECSLLITGLVK